MTLTHRRDVLRVASATCASLMLALACSGAPRLDPLDTLHGNEHTPPPSQFAQVLWPGVGLHGIQAVDWSVPCQQLYQMRLPQLEVTRPLAIREVKYPGHQAVTVVLHVRPRWGRSIPSRTLSVGVTAPAHGGPGVNCWLSEPGLCGSLLAAHPHIAVTAHDAPMRAPQSTDESHGPEVDAATPDTPARLAIQCAPDAPQSACDGELRVEFPIDAAWLLRNYPEYEPRVVVFLLSARVHAPKVHLARDQDGFQLALPISARELTVKVRAHMAALVGERGS